MTEVLPEAVPAACTLPTSERPLRVAELGRLLADGLRSQTRLSPTRLRWVLDPAASADARDLAARESRCCSFFAFRFTRGEGGDGAVVVDVEVPAARSAVLDALAQLGARTTGRQP